MANQVQNPEARALLEAAGLTPSELRTLTGVTPNAMSRWWTKGLPRYAKTILAQRIIARQAIEVMDGDDNAAYGIAVPGLSGCFTAGDTMREAELNLIEAVVAWIEASVCQDIALRPSG